MLYMPDFEGWQLSNQRAKPASRIDPRRKQTRFTAVKAIKTQVTTPIYVIPNVQLMTKSPTKNITGKMLYFLG